MMDFRDQLMQWVDQDAERIVEFCRDLTRCKSPTPPGDTREVMGVVQRFLDAEGLPFREVNADDTMPNLISSVRMPHEGRHLMFNGHLDVLPAGQEPGWTDDPWSATVTDGRIWGRGTSDMKAGVTAMVFAYTYLSRIREQLAGRMSLTLVSDEEAGGGRGVGHLFQQIADEMEADCVLSGEPSGTKAVRYASKGYLKFSVRVRTRGAISGYPNLSKNAIHVASDIIRDLDTLTELDVRIPSSITDKLDDPHARELLDELMGAGTADILPRITVSVGTIQGGNSVSVIAPECVFAGTVVVPVGTDPDLILTHVTEIVARHPEAALESWAVQAPDVSDPAGELALILQETVDGLGRPKPELLPAIAISDCRYWRYRGTPAYWYGPEGNDCSAANESVSVEDVLHLVRTHALAAAQYLTK